MFKVQHHTELLGEMAQRSAVLGRHGHALPEMPHRNLYSATYQVKDDDGKPLAGGQYMIKLPSGEVHYGITDKQGNSRTAYGDSEKPIKFTLLDSGTWEQEEINSVHHKMDMHLSKNNV